MKIRKSYSASAALFLVWLFTAFYFSVVLYLSFFKTAKYCGLILPLTIFFFLIIRYGCKKTSLLKVEHIKSQEASVKVFAILFGIVAFGNIFYWFLYYPGGFNLDSYGQWQQAHGIYPLDNWHPVFTTFIYWLETRVIDRFEFCIFVQILMFSLSFSLLLYDLFKAGVPQRILTLSAVIVAFTPAVSSYNICLIKDVFFTVSTIWLFRICLKIYLSKGEWLSYNNVFFFAAAILISMLTRHNAVFFTAPLLILILIKYKKKAVVTAVVIVSSVFTLFLIEKPLYNAFNVEKHQNVVGESVGIPMSIMTNAFVNDNENTPDNVKIFMEQIASEDELRKHYIIGEWDSCKWEFGGIDLLKGEKIETVLKLTWETIKKCPESAYQSFRENTRVIWQVFEKPVWNANVYIEPNPFNIVRHTTDFSDFFKEEVEKFTNEGILSTLLWNVGIQIILLLLLQTENLNNQSRKIIFIVPVLMYDFLTSALLCGPSHRYFYFNNVLFPVICCVSIFL